MSVAPHGTARTAASEGQLPPPAGAAARAPAPAPWAIPFRDLVDRLDLDGVSDGARDQLRSVSVDLTAIYRRNDAAAQSGARQHELIVLFLGVFGTLAVLLAIAKLANILHTPGQERMEPIAAGIAALLVVLGIGAARHKSWLRHRHCAERCQFLFWQLLVDPALWSSTQADVLQALAAARAEMKAIEGVRDEQLAEWSEADELVDALPPVTSRPTGSLASLYMEIRLRGQARYFEGRSAHNHWLDRGTRFMFPAFVLSVLAALGHFAFSDSAGLAPLSAGLLFAAAAIPALMGGVRLVRGALEPARNFARYRGKHVFLKHLLGQIEKVGDDSAALLRDLAAIERVLRAEHREWLRLMMEAEWIG